MRGPKRRGGRKGRRCKSEGLVVESARCYLPCPVVLFPFLFFYLSFSLSLSLPLFPPVFLSIFLFLSNRLLSRKRVSFHFSGGNAAICRSYLVKRNTHASNRKTFRWNTLKRFRHLSLWWIHTIARNEIFLAEEVGVVRAWFSCLVKLDESSIVQFKNHCYIQIIINNKYLLVKDFLLLKRIFFIGCC